MAFAIRQLPEHPHSVLSPAGDNPVRWLDGLPVGVRREVKTMWRKIANRDVSKEASNDSDKKLELWQRESKRESEANLFVLDFFEKIKDFPLSLSASNDEICDFSEKQAGLFYELNSIPAPYTPPVDRLLERIEKLGIEVRAETESGVRARLSDPLFWRRKTRKHLARKVESLARNDLGLVSRRKQIYCSDDSVKRRRQQNRRNKALLEACTAINQLGQEFTLLELMEVSTANPAIRRAELMTRISGFEHIALSLGHAGEFVTLTCPSRFHARRAKSGDRNPKFDGSTPTDAAGYLQKVWARIQSSLAREEIKIYGFRVAEPHHDGTPHWHGLFFLAAEHVVRFRQIVARHACRENKEELSLHYALTHAEAQAQAKIKHARLLTSAIDKKAVPSVAKIQEKIKVEKPFWDNPSKSVWSDVSARVEFKAIDWNRGTAAGYIAKYIAKNIDGINNAGDAVGFDYETDGQSTIQTAERVDAWASTWGIRQFQQIGGAPVTVWRELRRLEHIAEGSESVLYSAAFAADKGDWGKFIQVMGAYERKRKDQPLGLVKEQSENLNRYGEVSAPKVIGVVEKNTGFFEVTRTNQWQIKLRGEVLGGVAAPWTCVNNSTFSVTQDQNESTAKVDWARYNKEEKPLFETSKKLTEYYQKNQIDIDSTLVIASKNAEQVAKESEAKVLLQKIEKMLTGNRKSLFEIQQNLKEGAQPMTAAIKAKLNKRRESEYTKHHASLEELSNQADQIASALADGFENFNDLDFL